MKSSIKQKDRKIENELYTYSEVREKFFPNIKRDFIDEDYLTRESFLDLLKQANHPANHSEDPSKCMKETKKT